MKTGRRAARIDDNQKEIVDSLRGIPGVSVEPGHDDILVGFRGKTYWFEIKNPDTVSKKTGKVLETRIKPDQKRLLATYTGHYKIVTCLDEILIEIRLL